MHSITRSPRSRRNELHLHSLGCLLMTTHSQHLPVIVTDACIETPAWDRWLKDRRLPAIHYCNKVRRWNCDERCRVLSPANDFWQQTNQISPCVSGWGTDQSNSRYRASGYPTHPSDHCHTVSILSFVPDSEGCRGRQQKPRVQELCESRCGRPGLPATNIHTVYEDLK